MSIKQGLKVSVVTVCLNSFPVIKETMESIFSQNYSNIEIIVIDGGSDDGTFEYLESVRFRLDVFVSEHDNGIYDAMNKGIVNSTGDYLIFMNSGDRFYKGDAIEMVMSKVSVVEDRPLLVSGKVQFEYKKELMNLYRYDSHRNGKGGLPHQATFVDVSIQKENLFDSRLNYVGDYELWRRLQHKGLFKVMFVDVVVAIFALGGASTSVKFDTNRYLERAYVDSLYDKKFNFLSLVKIFLKIPVRRILKNIVGGRRMFILMHKINNY